MESQLDPIFQESIDSKRIPGVAAVALNVDGKVLFSKGYGKTTIGDSTSPDVTAETPAMTWSCSKLVTCVVMLQLIEQGKADIMDPAAKYFPAITELQLLKGWSDDGSPILVKPKKEILLLHLFTHTSGMGYDFFNADLLKWRGFNGEDPMPYITKTELENYMTPLVFEPGTRHEYGVSVDFLGFVVEKITGQPLDEYIHANIINPLDLRSMRMSLTKEQDNAFLVVHSKDPAGVLTPTPLRNKEDPEIVAAGHYLYSSTSDYAQFLLTLLNNGTHPTSKVKILEKETVQKYLFTDMLPAVGCSSAGVGEIPSILPPVSNVGTLLPGVPKGWSTGGMINLEDTPNGRKKGSLAWCGLGNTYFWVDPTEGVLGYVVTAVLPFIDKDVLHLADALERAVYGRPVAKEVGEKGSNFDVK